MRRITITLLTALIPACGAHATSPAQAPAAAAHRTRRPPPVLMHPADSDLGRRASDASLGPGARAPLTQLSDIHGAQVALSTWIGHGPLAVVFYRGGWCPYCSVQLHELAARSSEFTRRGVQLLAISVDHPAAAAEAGARWEIPFPVLADPDLATHEAYGVVHSADESEVARLRSLGIDLEAASGRAHHRFAVPSIFLIDGAGVIRWAHSDPDYRTRPSAQQLLQTIDQLSLR